MHMVNKALGTSGPEVDGSYEHALSGTCALKRPLFEKVLYRMTQEKIYKIWVGGTKQVVKVS